MDVYKNLSMIKEPFIGEIKDEKLYVRGHGTKKEIIESFGIEMVK